MPIKDDNKELTLTTTRKRGSKSASIEANFTGDKSEIGKIINDSYRWFNYQIPKTDEEFAERLNEFFRVCDETDSFPTVEKMALALGTTRKTVWEWEQGNGTTFARSDMIKKAKQIMAGIDADLVQSGKIPQITYIFRSKNFYDMKDTQDVVLTPNQPLGQELTKEQIRQAVEELPEYGEE